MNLPCRASPIRFVITTLVVTAALAATAEAHPLVENALDVVIARDKIVVDARISMEEVLLVGGGGTPTRERLAEITRSHGAYVLKHTQLTVDGARVEGKEISAGASSSRLAAYRFEYVLMAPPATVQIEQDFLREFEAWTASCVVRVRQNDQSVFQSGLLTRNRTIAFDCVWHAGSATRPAAGTDVKLWPTVRDYVAHGIKHILTGYDHLLFISALVLAASRLWDLVKVVTAFTLAHTLTLTLSVFNVVTLSERIVEPMIAASIVFVAVQNIFWPNQARGWTRLAVAFAFGLFHGLGFAGGLKDAMGEMPSVALWAALMSFSIGVEIGHQVVVLPLFASIQAAKKWNAEEPRMELAGRILKLGSCGISVAGVYFLIQAIR